jgi:hypothetical protein
VSEAPPLHYVLADGLSLGESHGEPVLIIRKAGLPTLGVQLPDVARAALVAALQSPAIAACDAAGEAGAPLLH